MTQAHNQLLTGVILVGGKGSRLADLYPGVPKPMIPVCNHPFLHWLVLWLRQQGVNEFVFAAGYRAEKIGAWLQEGSMLLPTQWGIFHEKIALGTGGSVRMCLPLCGDVILVANGDSLIMAPLRPMIESFLATNKYGAMIVGKTSSDTARYARLVTDSDGRLVEYHEKTPGQGLISAGIYMFRKSLLESFPLNTPLSMEYEILPQLLASGIKIGVYCAPETAPFIDIGTPETIAQADQFIRDNFKVSADS